MAVEREKKIRKPPWTVESDTGKIAVAITAAAGIVVFVVRLLSSRCVYSSFFFF